MNNEQKIKNIKYFYDWLKDKEKIFKSDKELSELIVSIKSMYEDVFDIEQESEDEKIRKWIIDDIRYNINNEPLNNSEYKKKAERAIAWLEKQGESDKSLYIRFGDIPTNGKSKIYNGEIEIGVEEGISVYPAFEDKEGNIILGLNFPITKTSLHTQQHLLEYDNRPCYLVTGDYVGKGTDGEPLIKNVRIIKEIKPYRVKEDKENNTYVINNTPNCSISVYNEEPKESEDERIRKELKHYLEVRRCQTQSDEEYINCNNFLAWLERQGTIIKDTISMDVNSETEWDDIDKFLRMNLDGEKVKLLIVMEE